jgi:ATP-binding cassette subfamily B protein
LVLTENGIAEDGTHNDLMASGGVYAGLHAVQGSI